MADYQKMYSLLCRVVDSVIDPLERIPLAAPYADVLWRTRRSCTSKPRRRRSKAANFP